MPTPTAKENLSTTKGARRKNDTASLGSELDGTDITSASEWLDLKAGDVTPRANETSYLGIGPVFEIVSRVGGDQIGS